MNYAKYHLHNACLGHHFHLQSKYKEASKKEMQSGSFTTLSETRDTAHSKEVEKLVSRVRMSLAYQKNQKNK